MLEVKPQTQNPLENSISTALLKAERARRPLPSLWIFLHDTGSFQPSLTELGLVGGLSQTESQHHCLAINVTHTHTLVCPVGYKYREIGKENKTFLYPLAHYLALKDHLGQ